MFNNNQDFSELSTNKFKNFASNTLNKVSQLNFTGTVQPISWLILVFTFIACLFMF